MSNETTPKRITPAIEEFCRSIEGSNPPPFFVPVRSTPGKLGDCNNIVNDYVAEHGGAKLIGWTIWEWPYILLSAELHAIWVSPSGENIDVTPKQDGERQILFLPDPVKEFPKGARVPNRGKALRDHPLVHEFFRLSEEMKGLLPAPGKMMLASEISKRAAPIQKRLRTVHEALERMAEVRRKSNWRKGKS